MKKLILILSFVWFSPTLFASTSADSIWYSQQFETADSLLLEGLPRSADSVLQVIFDQSLVDNNQPVLLMTINNRMINKCYYEQNALISVLRMVENIMTRTQFPVKQVAQLLLAKIYANYFNNDSWRISRRTNLENSENLTIETGDLNYFKQMVYAYADSALTPSKQLQEIPVSQFEKILKGDKNNRTFRPTLYDLIAHELLSIYQSFNRNSNNPEDRNFNHPELFLLSDHFIHFPLNDFDSLSTQFKTIELYQQLTRHHLQLKSEASLVDLELNRLRYFLKNNRNDKADELYRLALMQLAKRVENSSSKAEVLYYLAFFYYNSNPESDTMTRIKAMEICEEIIKDFPDTEGADKSINLQSCILNHEIDIKAKALVIPKEDFLIRVEYKNLDRMFFRLYKTPLNQKDNYRYGQKSNQKELLTSEAYRNWSQSLPVYSDYLSHGIELPVQGLPIGFYTLFISDNEYFSDSSNIKSINFAATNLFVSKRKLSDTEYRFSVNHSKTGCPLNDVQLQFFKPNYQRNKGKTYDHVLTSKTNEQGFCDLKTLNNGHAVCAIANGDTLWINYTYMHHNPMKRSGEKSYYTSINTDRPIYRPGQTVHFKGQVLCEQNDSVYVGKNKKETVTFIDPNGEELDKKRFVTNEFGSFSGSFVIPTGLVNGRFELEAKEGSQFIRVEEYKRPTFDVALNKPKKVSGFGDSVSIKGIAKAFTGYFIDNAKVEYTITKTIRRRYFWRPDVVNRQIANGTLNTNERGEFIIGFVTDQNPNQKDAKIYEYEVSATVVDRNGETHKANLTIPISKNPLQVMFNVPEQLFTKNFPNITIQTQNLSNEPILAEVKIELSKLESPGHVLFDRLWEKPDTLLLTKDAFRKQFPNRVYHDENNMDGWKKVKTLKKIKKDCDGEIELNSKLFNKLKTGSYRLEICAKTSEGHIERIEKSFWIYNKMPKDIEYSNQWIVPIKTAGKPGETAEFWVASLTRETPVRYLVADEDNTQSFDLKPGLQYQRISIPITREHCGGFKVQFIQIANGKAFQFETNIDVPDYDRDLDIKFTTFRNKLLPGEQEKWTLQIKNLEGQPEKAELLATLYDASLDGFNNLRWFTQFQPPVRHLQSFWDFSMLRDFNYPFTIDKNYTRLSQWSKSYEMFDLSYNYWGRDNYYYHLIQNKKELKRQKLLAKFLRLRKEPIKVDMIAANDSLFKKNQKAGLVTLSGNVMDANTGESIPGANIIVVGTTKGTLTNMEGEFELKDVPKNVWVSVQFIGYDSFHLQLNETNDILLFPSNENLDEVVVVGYGMQKKEALVSAIGRRADANPIMIRGSGAVAADMDIMEEEMEMDMPLLMEQSASMSPQVVNPVIPRTNFSETAFFYPHLLSDENGEVSIEFTIPESLTKWKMRGLAHTKDLKVGTIEKYLVTQKEVSIMANTPRFFRMGDTIEFSAKVSNLTAETIDGQAKLELFNAETDEELTSQWIESDIEIPFHIEKQISKVVRWKLVIPHDVSAVNYKITAQAGSHTDGEENSIPVLPNRKLVTESLPFMVRAYESKKYHFEKLIDHQSKTLKHHALTVETTSNPNWYAIQSLPYLMEFPHECTEQLFSRFYANSLASYLVNGSPQIKKVFDAWQQSTSDALQSNLEKKQELKEVLLQETPWLRNAKDESIQKRQIALLFEENNIKQQLSIAIDKLSKKQLSNGAFPWFEGMYENRYITQYIANGISKMYRMGILDQHQTKALACKNKAYAYLDKEIVNDYQNLLKRSKDKGFDLADDHLRMMQVDYLYGRSFKSHPQLTSKQDSAYQYYYQQAKKYWLTKSNRAQAMLAMTFYRNGDQKMAHKIIKSLINRATQSKELGMYWPVNSGYGWYESPIETQSMIICAFKEIGADAGLIEEMKIWLLRNKQTNHWGTTKTTVNATFALIGENYDALSSTKNLEITLGNQPLKKYEMNKAEAGTGYQKTVYAALDIKPEMGQIEVQNPNDNVAWGAVYWQYFEQLDKITKANNQLKIEKQLFFKKLTDKGPVLKEIKVDSPVIPGDEVVVRMVITTDRDMEFVHLKDQRASCFEPMSSKSGYQYRQGLGYYLNMKDASANFFFDDLPKGTHVFEYSLRAVHNGTFSNGITTLQNMYAPEFNAHSEGVRVNVK